MLCKIGVPVKIKLYIRKCKLSKKVFFESSIQSKGYTSSGAFCSTDDVTIAKPIMAYLALVYRV